MIQNGWLPVSVTVWGDFAWLGLIDWLASYLSLCAWWLCIAGTDWLVGYPCLCRVTMYGWNRRSRGSLLWPLGPRCSSPTLGASRLWMMMGVSTGWMASNTFDTCMPPPWMGWKTWSLWVISMSQAFWGTCLYATWITWFMWVLVDHIDDESVHKISGSSLNHAHRQDDSPHCQFGIHIMNSYASPPEGECFIELSSSLRQNH